MESAAPNLQESVYIKSINIYQWIFSVFGLNLPPQLLKAVRRNSINSLLITFYLTYCILIVVFAIGISHIHHVIITNKSEISKVDVLSKLLTYTQNILLVSVQILLEIKTLRNYRDLRNILNLIAYLEDSMTVQYKSYFKKSLLKWKLLSITGLNLILLTVFVISLNYIMILGTITIEFRLGILFLMSSLQVKCMEYGMYVQLIYEFMSCLCQTLARIIEEIEDVPLSTLHSSQQTLVQQLMHNQLLLNRILLLVSSLSKYFACSMLMIFFYNAEAILNIVNSAYIIGIGSGLSLYCKYIKKNGYILKIPKTVLSHFKII